MFILLRSKAITPDKKITACQDPKDNQYFGFAQYKFLEVAAAEQANVIVSRNKDLLVFDPFENIPIITPHSFLAMLQD